MNPKRGQRGKSLGSLVISISLLSVFFLLTRTEHAHAYIDAGTGSLILQILLGTLFGTLFMLKVFWRRFTGRVSRLLFKKKSVEGPDEVGG